MKVMFYAFIIQNLDKYSIDICKHINSMYQSDELIYVGWLDWNDCTMIIKLAMKEQEKSHKATVELRKHSLSEKTRSDYSSPFTTKEDSFGVFLGKGGKTFGKKYVQ